MRKSSPPKNPAPTEKAVGASDGSDASEGRGAPDNELGSDEWQTAFESPDDLWMRFLARAEKDESIGQPALDGWLTNQELTETAEHEWRLLGGADPTSED